jgi:hypothetical protein
MAVSAITSFTPHRHDDDLLEADGSPISRCDAATKPEGQPVCCQDGSSSNERHPELEMGYFLENGVETF